MVEILRKEGWVLNPKDKALNSLLKAIERNNGECPCSGNQSTDKHCPCSDYREHNKCCCGLYLKISSERTYPVNYTGCGNQTDIEGD